MIDAEVVRLRRLRNTALRARAIAAVLDSHSARRSSLWSRSALSCWQIARVITGRLRGHPYLRYQRGPSDLRIACDRVSANWLGGIARYRGRGLKTLSGELRRVVRELDDARALTWSAELGDTFGRSQTQIRKLIRESDGGARSAVGSHHDTVSRVEAGVGADGDDAVNVAANWPYLAF